MRFLFYKTRDLNLGVLSGLLVGVSYHAPYLGIIAYFGFIPLFHSWINNNPKKNLITGYIFGVTYNLISNYWIATNSGAPFYVVLFSLLAAVAYLSIFWGIAGAVVGFYNKTKLIYYMLPFLIVSLEWIRSFGPLGFSWGNLALTQINILPLLQHIDYAGTYIITSWVIIINVILYYQFFVNKIERKRLFYIIFVLILFFCSGWLKMKIYELEDYSDSVNIAIIQPNIDPNEKWNKNDRIELYNFMDSLYTEAIKLNPDLILFPETALPTYIRINNAVKKQLQSRVDSSMIPILIGTVDRRFDSNKNKKFYNSTIYFQPKKDFEIYDKIHLVPFAEYDLLPSFLHPLVNLNINIDRGVFKAGEDYKIFKFKDLSFSGLICYESSLPRYARRFTKKGANLLMIQANDGWLGNSQGPYQHFNNAILRAIENRVPIARSGNTGISGVILPSGRVVRKIVLDQKTVFSHQIPYNKSSSFYSHFGDLFAVCSFIIFLFIGPVITCIKKY